MIRKLLDIIPKRVHGFLNPTQFRYYLIVEEVLEGRKTNSTEQVYKELSTKYGMTVKSIQSVYLKNKGKYEGLMAELCDVGR